MGALLVDEWLPDEDALSILDEASVALARQKVRHAASALGLPSAVAGALATCASELAHNQLAHARGGRLAIRPVSRGGIPGLEIVAADDGDGIVDPTKALRGSPRAPESHPRDDGTKASLGIGLAGVLELSDETDFDVRIGEGTCIRARKFAEAVSRRREVGIFGRPFPGEAQSGDHGAFVRGEDTLVVGVSDGLGHGPSARVASDAAIESLRVCHASSLEHIFKDAHAALTKTRGAVMSAVQVREPEGHARLACAGNVAVHVYELAALRRYGGVSCVLGAPGQLPRLRAEETVIGGQDVLVLFTDGLVTRASLEGERDLLLRHHPIIVAQQLVERFARGNDDVLVLVAR